MDQSRVYRSVVFDQTESASRRLRDNQKAVHGGGERTADVFIDGFRTLLTENINKSFFSGIQVVFVAAPLRAHNIHCIVGRSLAPSRCSRGTRNIDQIPDISYGELLTM